MGQVDRNPPSSLARDERGITTVEFLVATAILALAATGGWRVFSASLGATASEVGDEVDLISSGSGRVGATPGGPSSGAYGLTAGTSGAHLGLTGGTPPRPRMDAVASQGAGLASGSLAHASPTGSGTSLPGGAPGASVGASTGAMVGSQGPGAGGGAEVVSFAALETAAGDAAGSGASTTVVTLPQASTSGTTGSGAGGSTAAQSDDMGDDMGSMVGLSGTPSTDGRWFHDAADAMQEFADSRGDSVPAQVVAGLTDVATLPLEMGAAAVDGVDDLSTWVTESDTKWEDTKGAVASATGSVVHAVTHPVETASAVGDAAAQAWDHCSGSVRGGTSCVAGAAGSALGAFKVVKAVKAVKTERRDKEERDAALASTDARVVGPAFVRQYFTDEEVARAHPTPTDQEIYHGAPHTYDVVGTEVVISRARGLSPKQVEYNGQVAFVHDLDSSRDAGKPARASVTIEDMEADFRGERPLIPGFEGSVLRDRFGWDERDLRMGQAMVLRTEFPFDQPRVEYGGRIPRDVHEEMLDNMSPEDQQYVIQEGAILSEYSDKGSGKMIDTFDETGVATDGLANEARNNNPDGFIPSREGNHGFIGTIGRVDRTPDGEIDPDGMDAFAGDRASAAERGLDVSLPDRDELFAELPPDYGGTFYGNLEGSRVYRETLAGGADRETAHAAGRDTYERVRNGESADTSTSAEAAE